MKSWMKASVCIGLSLMFCFMSIGYAALTDTLSILGDIFVPKPDTIILTNVEVASQTTETASAELFSYTAVDFNISGTTTQKVTYKLTACNYSETDTFVFTGCSNSTYESVISQMTIETYISDDGTQEQIPGEKSSADHYYEGTPIAPGEEFEFYITLTLDSNFDNATNFVLNFDFVPVIYTITYINNSEVLSSICVSDNSSAVSTENTNAAKQAVEDMGGGYVFSHWMNAGSTKIEEIPADNTEDVVLYPSFDGVFTATFVDQDGTILAYDFFTKNDYGNIVKLGEETDPPQIEDCVFDYWQVHVTKNGETTKKLLSEYNFADEVDVTIYPVYTYDGDVNLIPVDTDGDGDTDEYHVGGYSNPDGQDLVEIPDYVNGIPITAINADAFSSYEGVHSVVIPTTVTTAGGNILATDWGFLDSGETVTIYYEGSYEEWLAKEATFTVGWDDGLGASSRIFFLNGTNKVDPSQGYLQASKEYKWGTGYYIEWNKSTVTSDLKNEYDSTCTCKDCNGADRPDRHYWTDVVIN